MNKETVLKNYCKIIQTECGGGRTPKGDNMKMYYFDFNKVKILVEARGIPVRQIGIKAGLSVHGVERMTSGKHHPRVDNVCKIACVLGVTPGFFFSEEEVK